VSAEYFKEVLNEEKAKLVTPINTDVAKEDFIMRFLEILNNQNKLLIKINSNIDELIKLVEKIGK